MDYFGEVGGFDRLMKTRRSSLAALVVMAVLAVACSADDLEQSEPVEDSGTFSPSLFDPTDDSRERPDDYRESLPRDAIFPVYDPTFVESTRVSWPEDELIIGVDLNGEQRAYPVGFLTFREIVIDNHRGIPTLVTW